MATIADLATSITQMDQEQAFQLIMQIRSERRKPKGKFAIKRARAAAKPKKQPDLGALLGALTPEQLAQLKEDLSG